MPVEINNDRSMVFILAGLHVINRESHPDVIERAWRIVAGEADSIHSDLLKMNVHDCAFHFLRDVGALAKQHLKSKECIRFAMWLRSLLMNADNLEAIEDLFSILIRISHTRSSCDRLAADVKSLNMYMETIDFSMKENAINVDNSKLEEMQVDLKVRGGTEKDVLEATMTPPF